MFYEKRPSKKAKKGYTWRVSFYYDDPLTGLTKKYSKSGFETRAEAQKHGQKAENELNNTGMIGKNITLSEAYSEWLELNSERLAQTTLETYKCAYAHLKPLCQKSLKKVQYRELQTLFNSLDISKSYKELLRALLSNVFKYAIKAGYIVNNPVSMIEITGKEKKAPEEALELDQVEEICRSVKAVHPFTGQSYQIFVWIGYYTGLRASEILALQWNDFDFENNTISVWKQKDRHSDILTEKMKTKASSAILPLCEPLKGLLLEWRHVNSLDMVCCKPDGSLISLLTIEIALKKAGKLAGIENFHPHWLRHTFITNLVRSGADPKTAAQLARHSDIHTTLNTYTQMNFEDLSTAVQRTFSQPVPKKSPKTESFSA